MNLQRYIFIGFLLVVGFAILSGLILSQNSTEESLLKQVVPISPIKIEAQEQITPSRDQTEKNQDKCPEGLVPVYEGGEFDGCHLPANGPECTANIDCEINEYCANGTCYENEDQEIQTCESFVDCPIINCFSDGVDKNEITAPCPSYKCIEELCVLID